MNYLFILKASFIYILTVTLLSFMISITGCQNNAIPDAPVFQKWHKVELTFEGPETSEDAEVNPFTGYRLNVTFSKDDRSFVVPGFYAADGNAGETSATSGKTWKVRFNPDEEGLWNYRVSFRQGENIAVSDDPEAGTPLAPDGFEGQIMIVSSDKTYPDFRARGRLAYVGRRYLKFSETDEYFIKGGADSPENFLAYEDFDGTNISPDLEHRDGEAAPIRKLHNYAPHAGDWKTGDPVWKEEKGKNIIGALNYLASKGMNSVYFLTMNIGGDGRDVYPYTSYDERSRFDCSKLDQWDIVFSHMESKGLMMHVVFQETENETLLDNGDTGPQRKLYFREMIARFGYHNAITWNMGEENGPAHWTPIGQSTEQQKAMIRYVKENDPYRHYTVIHTHSDEKTRHEMYEKLLGDENLDGPSIQIHPKEEAHKDTKYWIEKSGEAGKQWVVCIDEIGTNFRGTDPDDREDNNQDTIRNVVLWGNLMAGGGGVEWYFGFLNHNNDLGCEDWRSRDRMWNYTRYALDFFKKIPFYEMGSNDALINDENAYCLAKKREVYAIYLPEVNNQTIDLTKDNNPEFDVKWYNPRTGVDFVVGNIKQISGGSVSALGNPPSDNDQDWVVLLEKL